MTKTSPPHLTLVSSIEREAPPGVSRDEELAGMMARMFIHGIFDETYFRSIPLADIQAILHLLRLGKVSNAIGKPGNPPVLPFVTDLTTACLMTSTLLLAIRVASFEKKLEDALAKLNDPYRV